MNKVLVVVYAGVETHEAKGRMSNAIEVVREFHAAGDDVRVIFEGAAVQWLPQISRKDHELNEEFQEIQPAIEGVCEFCADAFGAHPQIEDLGYDFLGTNRGHPSLRGYKAEGFDVLTF